MEPGLPLRPHSAAPSLAPVPHYTDLGLEAGGGQLSPGPGYHEAAVRSLVEAVHESRKLEAKQRKKSDG